MKLPGTVALAWSPHHLDHLAPLAECLDATVLSTDDPDQSAAAACYPRLALRWVHGAPSHHGVARLFATARALRPRVVLYSDLFARRRLAEFLGGPDTPRIVYVPHGFSEKRQDWAARTSEQDIACFPGAFAVDQLRAYGRPFEPSASVITGHLRRHAYRRHRAHFDGLVDATMSGDTPAATTVLYAPTWQDAIGSSSFFAAFSTLASRLPEGWRLVVKLHPLAERESGAIDRLAALAHGRDIRFVRRSPLTMPLLERVDAYVGDMSALAYDFLALDRPMVFLNRAAGTPADASASRLYACGEVLAPERYGDVYDAIRSQFADRVRFSGARLALDRYTYADREPADVVADLVRACESPAPDWLLAGGAGEGR